MRILILLLLLTPLMLLAPAPAPASDDMPRRTADNLIVAAYNIQWLGQRRHDLDKIARVIQHFDVCGILEVRNEKAVPELVGALETLTGKDWGYVYGVRTHRPGSHYHEAYAAVWRRDRARLGDGLVSNVWDLEEAFRNDPFVVSFASTNACFDFAMLLIHTRWSDDEEGSRQGEVAMLAEQLAWMRQFIPERDWLVAGDFNYPGDATPMREMAQQAGLLQIDPDQLSTFKTDGSGYASAYDHIYIIDEETAEFIDGQCGILDATRLVYGDNSPDSMKKARTEISDHLPVWAVFDVTGPDDD